MRTAFLFVLIAAGLYAESAAGLKWTAPAGWSNRGSQPMRAATYIVPAASGDRMTAECVVYYFGPGQGGSVQANIDRWKSQFTQGGKPAEARVGRRTVHGLPVTTIETAGDYSGMGGPLATTPTIEKSYRLLGAIIEGPQGSIFIKFTGPAKTVGANQSRFEQLVDSFETQGK